MSRRGFLILVAALALSPVARVSPVTPQARPAVSRLPAALSGQDFWKLSVDLSEPDGAFRSDNLVSNEMFMQRVIPDLVKTVRPGRAYLGVGPEQNFTYIAATRPSMAFVIDVRRGNLHLHLMYKALFELSSDRADFVSRLFSMKRPAGLGVKSTAQEIFAAYDDAQLRREELHAQNVAAMRDLFKTKKIVLPADDWVRIERVYREFFSRGLDIHYEVTPGSAGSFPTYAELMTATDSASMARSFLASEENFAVVRDLQRKNLIVPVVGNFAGASAIRAVGAYLKKHGTIVGTFYVSNVEQYLLRENMFERFCANVGALPLDAGSTFIRSERGGFGGRSPRGTGGFGPGFTSQLHNIRDEIASCGR
jgi:hypothetical protein